MSFIGQLIELQTQTEENFLQILFMSMHIGLLLVARMVDGRIINLDLEITRNVDKSDLSGNEPRAKIMEK